MANGLWDDLFGGIFDFNGDGKTSISEQWAGGFAFKECTQEDMSGVVQKSWPAENTDGTTEKNTLSEKGKENRQKNGKRSERHSLPNRKSERLTSKTKPYTPTAAYFCLPPALLTLTEPKTKRYRTAIRLSFLSEKKSGR